MTVNRAVATLVVLVLAGCAGSGPAAPGLSGSWPMYRGDDSGDGHPATATLDAAHAARLSLAWKRDLGAAIDGTPAVSAGVVLAGSANGKLIAFRLDTGAKVWETDNLGAIMGSPAIVDQQVLVGTLTGRIYSIGMSDGRVQWSWQAPDVQAAIWSSPIPFGSLVLVGTASPYGDNPLEPGRLVALDRASGQAVWTDCMLPDCSAGDGVWSSAAIDAQGRAYVGVGNPDDAVVAVDAATGRMLWKTTFHPDLGRDLDVGASPVIVTAGGRETVAVGSVAGDFKMLDAHTGAPLWSRDLVSGSAVHGLIGSPGSDGRLLYVPSASPPSGIFALAPGDGHTVWMRKTAEAVYSSVAIGAGVILFGTGEVFGSDSAGRVVALASADGRVLWTFDAGSALLGGAAVVGSRVVIGDAKGDLFAFAPSG